MRTSRWVIWAAVTLTVVWVSSAPPAQAQVPGLDEPAPTASAKAEPNKTVKTGNALQDFVQAYVSEESPYRGPLLALATLLVLMLIRRALTNAIKQHLDAQPDKIKDADAFFKTWNRVWRFVIALLAIIAMSGSLKLLGLSASFLGMMLGWSLQAPVTGIAAWLMVVLKRPFKVGDRVVIAGIMGDVTAITLTHVVLNQVGGTVGGEERSGRGILIPTAILFSQVITNYTFDAKYVLDEVGVRVTFDSDWDLAKQIGLRAAREATKDTIADTKQEPYIRCEFIDAGMYMRVRYQTEPPKRQETSSIISESILREFKKNYDRVKFSYPHSVVAYRPEKSGSSLAHPYVPLPEENARGGDAARRPPLDALAGVKQRGNA
jgi:small-conductance mechanosensitive channel